MNNQDYEQKKKKCWLQFCQENGVNQELNISIFDAFDYVFDRAYALGKQTETISQEDIEKSAEKFADGIRIPASFPGFMVPFINGLAHDSYLQGAQDFIGKHEKEADTVISGWAARDKDNMPRLHYDKPERTSGGYWQGGFKSSYLPRNVFPDLTWESDPLEVELVIKRKKKNL
jgi:hypothetical protein